MLVYLGCFFSSLTVTLCFLTWHGFLQKYLSCFANCCGVEYKYSATKRQKKKTVFKKFFSRRVSEGKKRINILSRTQEDTAHTRIAYSKACSRRSEGGARTKNIKRAEKNEKRLSLFFFSLLSIFFVRAPLSERL